MTLTGSSIQIENPDFPLLGKIDLNPLEITDSNSGNSITFQKLCYLPIGLASLEPPPNNTTLHIQDTLEITDASGNKTLYSVGGINNSIANNIFSIQNSGGYDMHITGSNQINMYSNDNINLYPNVNCIIQPTINAGNSIILNSSNGTINMGDYNDNNKGTKVSLNDTNQEFTINTGINNVGLIRMGDINSTATQMVIDVSNNYISQYSGKMGRNEIINITTLNNYLEPYANFYSTDTDVKLYNVSYYLNVLNTGTNSDGWFCYLFNYTGSDITATNDDNINFVCHSTGVSTSQTIRKYATVRLTLVYLPSAGNYVWSVLMY